MCYFCTLAYERLGGKNPLFAPCIPENNLVVIVGGFHF
jgi:hypothetical protein